MKAKDVTSWIRTLEKRISILKEHYNAKNPTHLIQFIKDYA